MDEPRATLNIWSRNCASCLLQCLQHASCNGKYACCKWRSMLLLWPASVCSNTKKSIAVLRRRQKMCICYVIDEKRTFFKQAETRRSTGRVALLCLQLRWRKTACMGENIVAASDVVCSHFGYLRYPWGTKKSGAWMRKKQKMFISFLVEKSWTVLPAETEIKRWADTSFAKALVWSIVHIKHEYVPIRIRCSGPT